MQKFEGAGGTSGGVGEFLVGLLTACAGAYMVLNQVQISARFTYNMFGSRHDAFGPVFTVFLLGLFFLFWDGRSKLGWVLTCGGLTLMFWGVIQSLEVSYRTTTGMNTIIMFGLLFAGLGLVFKSLQPH